MSTTFSGLQIENRLIFEVTGALAHMVSSQVPELKVDLPNFQTPLFRIGFDHEICIATVECREAQMPTGGSIKGQKFDALKAIIGSARSYQELSKIEALADYFSWNKFIFAVDVKDDVVEWNDVMVQATAWLNDQPWRRANEVNKQRVKRAIPLPPQYSLEVVLRSLWVLECNTKIIQGTAFDLLGYGTVTNAHVIDGMTDLVAYRAFEPTKKFKVSVLAKHSALDLALITVVDGQVLGALHPNKESLAQMAHVAVCGFPNFALGDTGVLSPGIVVGFRQQSGVQRLLTNAGIVAGMSGGPAIGANNMVIGVCTTGAELMKSTKDTEDQSIIPIAALDLLLSAR